MLNAIRQDEDNPAAQAMMALFAMLYPGGHQYGRPAKGAWKPSVGWTARRSGNFTVRDFSPAVLTVIIVGDIGSERAASVSLRVFGAWHAAPPAEAALAHPAAPAVRRERVIR